MQDLGGIARLDLHRFLENDLTAIGNLIDKMDRSTGHLYAVIQSCLVHPQAIESLTAEGRDQRGVDIEDPLGIAGGEGFAEDGIKKLVRFANQKGQRVVLSGDVMFDNSLHFSEMAERKSDIIERLGLTKKQFVLATIHRPANTDNSANLQSIFKALLDISDSQLIDVVLPLHPRTRNLLQTQPETPNP